MILSVSHMNLEPVADRRCPLPLSIQQIIIDFSEINVSKIKISTAERQYSIAPGGEIEFIVHCYDEAEALGTFKGLFDKKYKEMLIWNDRLLNQAPQEQVTLDELQYFEIGNYQYDEADMFDHIKRSLLCVIDFIHSCQDGHYQTLELSKCIIDSLGINITQFKQKWNVFQVDEEKYALLRAIK